MTAAWSEVFLVCGTWCNFFWNSPTCPSTTCSFLVKCKSHFTPEWPRLRFFSHKSSLSLNSHMGLDNSEERARAVMGRVYDATENIPSQWSPLSPVTFIFSRRTNRSWQSFFFFFPTERCFQLPHHNLPVTRQTLLWKYPFSKRKRVVAVLLKVAWTPFTDCVLVTGAGCCLSLRPPERVFAIHFETRHNICMVPHWVYGMIAVALVSVHWPPLMIPMLTHCTLGGIRGFCWVIYQMKLICKTLSWWHLCHSNHLKTLKHTHPKNRVAVHVFNNDW